MYTVAANASILIFDPNLLLNIIKFDGVISLNDFYCSRRKRNLKQITTNKERLRAKFIIKYYLIILISKFSCRLTLSDTGAWGSFLASLSLISQQFFFNRFSQKNFFSRSGQIWINLLLRVTRYDLLVEERFHISRISDTYF